MIDRDSPAGSWDYILQFCRNITVLNNIRGEQPERDRPPSSSFNLHDKPCGEKGQHNHD